MNIGAYGQTVGFLIGAIVGAIVGFLFGWLWAIDERRKHGSG